MIEAFSNKKWPEFNAVVWKVPQPCSEKMDICQEDARCVCIMTTYASCDHCINATMFVI